MKTDPIEITGITLIDKILEFVSMIPDPKIWTLKKLKDNESGFIRLQQIDVLLKLFVPEIHNPIDIRSNIESVLNGEFIQLRKTLQYDTVFNQMDKTILESKYHPEKTNEWTTNELKFNYKKLIKYKTKLNEVLKFNDGIMEISYPYFYFVILTNDVRDNLQLKEIDKFVSLVVDPSERIIAKEQLIKEYNYPSEDIYDIELENW